jgi:hypothetical protein
MPGDQNLRDQTGFPWALGFAGFTDFNRNFVVY